MSGPFLATVVYRKCKNCFLSVPREWIVGRSESSVLIFEVHYNISQRAVLSWSGEVTAQSGFLGTQSNVEINGFFAQKLGLEEGSQVVVNIKKEVNNLESLTAEPVAIDDWEILELNASYVQENLMNQARVVWDGQVLPIWVNQSMCILVKIGTLSPSVSFGVLQQNTEVSIVPKTRDSHHSHQASSASVTSTSIVADSEPTIPNLTQADALSSVDKNLTDEIVRDQRDATIDGENELARPGWSLTGYVRNAIGTLFAAEDKLDGNRQYTNFTSAATIAEDVGTTCSAVKYGSCILRLHPVDMVEVIRCFDSTSDVEPCEERSPLGGVVNLAALLKQPTSAFVLSESLADCRRTGGTGGATRVPFVVARLVKCVPPLELNTSKSSENGDDSNNNKRKPVSATAKGLDRKSESASKRAQDDTASKTPHCFVKLVIVDWVADFLHLECDVNALAKLRRTLLPGVVLVQDSVRRQLSCPTAHPIKLNFEICDIARPTSIQLHLNQNELPQDNLPLLTTQTLLKKSFLEICPAHCPLLIANNSLVEISSYQGQRLDFLLTTSERPSSREKEDIPLLISSHCNIQVNLKPLEGKEGVCSCVDDLDLPVVGLKSAALGGVDDVLRQCLTHLKLALCLSPLSQCLRRPSTITGEGLLLCGADGTGKTTLARSLCRELSAAPNYVFPSVVSCKSLKGKRVETISKVWKRIYREAQFRAPSIVILDDLDQVISAPSGPENEIGSVAVYHNKLADSLREILKSVKISHNSRVVTIVTCPNPTTIHKTISAPQGVHLFPNVVQLEAPNLEQREDILKHLILSKTFLSSDSLESVDWRPLAMKLEGFVARDLEMVVDRSAHNATAKRSCQDEQELVLTNDDFDQALNNFVPIALRGLQLHVPGKLGWKDVGGLSQVKKTLVETLQWPSKYPELFAKCPLAMRSGILLYGPPGTGKTLLANVVAKECAMSFISIKGPELLSKYIGASEQSVRDLFERAANAKPCVIFFDEFDSLAPRRGHDSTGVTDRVVNQLLTQMDGVEGRKGVYVLAATSRPDLIDPALLRPGRLDKCLYCPLPDTEDRSEILKALSQPMNLSPDVDMDSLAVACDFFSGADIQGLLYNAQLGAIHRTLDGESRYRDSSESSSPESRDSPHAPGGSDVESFDIVDCKNGDTTIRSWRRSPSSSTNKSSDRGDIAFTHVPTLEDGLVPLSEEVNKTISKQIETISSNLNGWPKTICDDSSNVPTRPSIVITLDDLLTAVNDMKPSVGETERRRYDAIYQMFVKSRGGGYFDASVNTVDKRATLA